MLLANEWSDYALIDCANGEKLEKWGSFTLVRPDPQIIWPHRSKSGGGSWEYNKKLPGAWQIKYKNLTFNVKPMGFKHTGIFPEQAVNWDFIDEKIKNANRDIKVLNLFAYTGGATVAAAKAGASVVHVDAAKGMVLWAKENAVSSGLADAPIRYIVDDVIKFVCREIRRGNKYDAIIMDPPTYGRGPNGEVWKFEDELYPLIEKCMSLLSDNPLFMIVNSYTSNVSSTVVKNVLELSAKAKFGGYVTTDEIAIPVKNSGICLPCGAATRWISK